MRSNKQKILACGFIVLVFIVLLVWILSKEEYSGNGKKTVNDEANENNEPGAAFYLTTRPSGAEVTVFQVKDKTNFPDFEPETGRVREENIVESVGIGGSLTTPFTSRGMQWGNYLLAIEKEGYAPVRFPILFEKGFDKNLKADVKLFRPEEIPENFIYVPAGWFKYGTEAEWRYETGFYISKYEVTWGEYFVWFNTLTPGEQKAREPFMREPGKFRRTVMKPLIPLMMSDPDWQNRPALGMTFSDIDAFLEWKNDGDSDGFEYSLPPETAWEKAARGVDGRKYPWGDEFSEDKVNYRGHYRTFLTSEFPKRLEFPGSRRNGASIYGVYQMAGNVREWTWRVGEGRPRIIRGASMYSEKPLCACAFRPSFDIKSFDDHGGFRLYVPAAD